MDIDKLFESDSLDGIADNVFGVVNNSVSEVKEMQRKKVAENVQLVVNALKKIESDISSRYDSVGNALEKRIITIKDGRDGADGRDGRNGKDGKNGRDGAPGPRGADGKNGLDGADGTDGVSVTNAHIDFDGSLVISLSSGQELNVGEVVAPALAEQIKVITNGGGTSQSVIDTLASLQAQITAISGASIYKGLWNASTNTPTLASGVGTSGNFYIVSVAGSTNLDGITNWGVGDWAIYNGTAWQRVEGGAAGNFTTVTASSLTSGRVTYAGTAGLLQDSANLTFNGTTLTANTIGAFTLSGTVAGGGNQLNNVIIGTTTPLAGAFTTLSATQNVSFQKAGANTLLVENTASTANVILNLKQTTGTASFGINSTAVYFDDTAARPYVFYTNGTERARINTTGLAVTGTLSATGDLSFPTVGSKVNFATTGSATVNYVGGSADGYSIEMVMQRGASQPLKYKQDYGVGHVWSVTGSDKMTLDSSGNLGLGVTPNTTFTGVFQIGANKSIESQGNGLNLFSNHYYNAGDKFAGTGYSQSYQMYNGIHSWYTSTSSGTAGAAITFTQAMTLDSSGNLLVGATSQPIGTSRAVFSTTGNTQAAIFINDTFNYSSTINWNKATANNNYFVEFGTEGTYTARGSITYNRAGGLTVYSTTSDYRLKENIVDLPDALETVNRLKPRQFDWKETGNTTTGFIAHELAEVCPHAVTGEKDATEMQQYEISPAVPATLDEEGNELTAAVEAVMGEREVPRYQGIDTSFLVATLTAAIQEQQAIITALTTRITALEAK